MVNLHVNEYYYIDRNNALLFKLECMHHNEQELPNFV